MSSDSDSNPGTPVDHDHDHDDDDDHDDASGPEYDSTHEREGVNHKIEIVVPAEWMSDEYDGVAHAYRGRIRLPGFRKGKAPLTMVRQQFGDQIRKHLLDHVIPEFLSRDLRTRELQPIESPSLDQVEFQPRSELRFSVRFDTAPEVQATNTDGLTATVEIAAVTDEAVDAALEQIRERAARLVPADDGSTITEGSFVRCEIALFPREGKGKRLAEEDRFVRVGEETAIPSLNAQLDGLRVDDERTFIAELGQEYPNAILAGKEVSCRVRVREIKHRQVPTLNDEFAKDLGVEDLATVRARITEDLEREQHDRAERGVEEQLLEQMRDRHPIDVPGSLIERRLDQMTQRLATEIAQQSIDPAEALDWRGFRAENRVAAERSIAEELLLDRLCEDEGLVVSDDDLDSKVETQLRASEGGKTRPLSAVLQQMRKDGSYETMRRTLMRRLALDRLKHHATIERIGGDRIARAGGSSD